MLYMYIHTRSFLCVHSRQSSFFFFFPFCFLHSPRLSSSPLSRLILLLFRLFFCDLTVLLCSRELFTLMWHWGGLLKMAGAPPSSISTRFEKSFFIFSNSNSAFEQFRVRGRKAEKSSQFSPLRCAVSEPIHSLSAQARLLRRLLSCHSWKKKKKTKFPQRKHENTSEERVSKRSCQRWTLWKQTFPVNCWARSSYTDAPAHRKL